MSQPTREDLEKAARAFFAELEADNNQPRDFHPIFFDEDVAMTIDGCRDRVNELDDQLRANQFDRTVEVSAAALVAGCGAEFENLGPPEKLLALQLTARAERESLELHIHRLVTPARTFRHFDELFDFGNHGRLSSDAVTAATPTPIPAGNELSKIGAIYLARKKAEGVGISQQTELARALGWLRERVSADRPLAAITKEELRHFRDDIARVDKNLRGKKLPFDARLTTSPSDQITSATAIRYWRSIVTFFEWAVAEGYCPQNLAAGLKLAVKKGEPKRTPAPFSTDELKSLFATPLYAGYQSFKRTSSPGQCHIREGHWWSGILLLFSGLRAGELAQLLPSDFAFDAAIPHLKVREEDESGQKVKTTKSASSIRDLPLAPVLLELGLRQFVGGRAKASPKGRVFREFRLGADRASDGATKYWGAYLRKTGLWKAGRATHVWRHTVAACLRGNDVAEEDIGAFLGHARQTVTAGYGGEYPLTRKMKTAERLDYGFDVVTALGGPFDPNRHI